MSSASTIELDYTSRKANSLAPILDEWCRLVLRFTKRHADDCVPWHPERPSIGVLAAAAWKRGGLAIEEYSEQKLGRSRSRAGRVDLWIEAQDGSEFYIETKPLRVPTGQAKSRSNVKRRVEKRLAWAVRDARDLQKRAKASRAGILFAYTTFKSRTDADVAWTALISGCRAVRVDFSRSVRLPSPVEDEESGYRCPGGVLLGRLVQ